MEKLATYIVRQGPLPARDAVGWIVRLCRTLQPHHQSGVAHGRVSAKAIQIEAPSCNARGFLLDAGDLADDPAYFSLDRATGGVRSPENDTWAVGVTLYFALTGALPFVGNTGEQVREHITSPATPLAVFDAGDDDLQILVDELFRKSFDERLKSLAVLRERLLEWEPWFADLPPLEFGRPEEAFTPHHHLVDLDADDLMETTSVAHRAMYPQLRAELLAQKERRGHAGDALPAPAPSERNLHQVPFERVPQTAPVPPPQAPMDPPMWLEPTVDAQSETQDEPIAPPPVFQLASAQTLVSPFEAPRPEPLRPDFGRPQIPRPEMSTVEMSTTETPRPEALRPELGRPELGRREFGRPEIATTEMPTTEDLRHELPTRQVPRPDARLLNALAPPLAKTMVLDTPPDGVEVHFTPLPPPPAAPPPLPPPPLPPPPPTRTPPSRPPPPSRKPADVIPAPPSRKPAVIQTPVFADTLPAAVDSPFVVEAREESSRPPVRAGSSAPPVSGIISSELPSALELLARPDSTPPPPISEPPPPPPVRRRRRRPSIARRLLFAVALFGVGYVAFDLYGKALWRYAQSVVPALRPSSAPRRRAPPPAAPAPVPPPPATESASTGETVEPVEPSATSPAPAVPTGDTQACIQPLFPEKTFTRPPDLDFLCSETQPSKGAGSLHTQVVLGGGHGGASEAMKEWATMGWYGMAVFAIARTHCCTNPQPLKTPTSLEHCKLDERLTSLAKAVLGLGSDDAADAALRDYTAAVNCLVRGGASDSFGQEGYPKGGEVTSFKLTYVRARQLATKP